MLLEIQLSPLRPFVQAFKVWHTVHCSAGPRRIAILYETLMSGCDATQIAFLPDPGVSGVRSMGPGVSMSLRPGAF